jgi:hypothetical protein
MWNKQLCCDEVRVNSSYCYFVKKVYNCTRTERIETSDELESKESKTRLYEHTFYCFWISRCDGMQNIWLVYSNACWRSTLSTVRDNEEIYSSSILCTCCLDIFVRDRKVTGDY